MKALFIVAAVGVGPITLAVWLDARLGHRRPSSPIWRIAHAAAAYAAVTIAGRTFAAVAHNDAPVPEQTLVVAALLVPAFAYAYASVLWLARTLSEVARLGRL